ncbi:MAG: 3'-5' exonuclease [Gammaproteobacteria bacterium]|nr:3'-5' exonuclease [Gammaproteobacteria bacterium]
MDAERRDEGAQILRDGQHRHPIEVSFDELADVAVVDVKTTGPDAERDRIVALVVMKATLPEIVDGLSTASDEVGVERARGRFNPGLPISKSASRLHGIEDGDVAYAGLFSDEARMLRTFIGDLPVVGHDVEVAAAFLDREFGLADVDSLDGNRKYCTKRRFCGDRRTAANSSLREMETALGLWRHVRSFTVDAEDRDAAAVLLAACQFRAVDSHLEEGGRRPRRQRPRLISDDALRTFVAVLGGMGVGALAIKALLPSALALIALLAIVYYFSPGMSVALGFLCLAAGWFMWWVDSRIKELDDEGDPNE